MHLQGLDLNLLVALDALLSEKNVTRAAERINISQPGMSAALQKLRYFFDDPLLERVGRNMELTNRGRMLAEPTKLILSQIRDLNEEARRFEPSEASRIFRIAATTFCAEILATPLIRKLQELAPRISVQFEDLSNDTVRRISDGQIDFAITISARIIESFDNLSESLASEKLFTDRFVVAISRDHRFSGDAISFDEFCDMPYIETRFAGVIAGVSEQLLRQQPRQPHVCAWLPNFQLTLDAIGQTNMVTLLPSLLVELKGDRYNVRTLPVPFAMPDLEERLFWHTRNNSDPGHSWMSSLLRNVITELMI
ncbi:LysR family transcriptional regulator [Sphingomonas naphthae]|uniref:LysR family transcriptional regulator n=1 Tax=Sphingomonas naphthae TaxID=1813468 RepID=A0ABY7TR68_9SPHN|nr:LysR family transcriptional regulator [Sphingomonas naphthae]WCT75132.1 LysR family transcriptional regulator [Sphingomonas naphthae]